LFLPVVQAPHHVPLPSRITPRNGITHRKSLQPTSATKSAKSGHRRLYSITASARVSNDGETVRLSAIAVLRLMTSSTWSAARRECQRASFHAKSCRQSRRRTDRGPADSVQTRPRCVYPRIQLIQESTRPDSIAPHSIYRFSAATLATVSARSAHSTKCDSRTVLAPYGGRPASHHLHQGLSQCGRNADGGAVILELRRRCA
jgi:hypothetical protein